MMNKLFLLAALVSMLFAVPLAFADVSDSAAIGASVGASSSESAAPSSGTGVSASSESRAATESAPAVSPTPLPPANEIAPTAAPPKSEIAPTPGITPAPTPLPPVKAPPQSIKPKTDSNDTYSVVVIPSSANLSVGQSQQFEAYLVVNGGVPQDVDFIWTTTGGIGTVTQDGLFTASAAGNGAVTATYALLSSNSSTSMVSGSAHVSVTNSPPPPPGNNSTAVVYLLVLPTSAILNVGDTQQFNAYLVVNGSITSDVPVAWSTTGGIGSIDMNGLFSATSAGTGTVVALYSGANVTLTGTAQVTVNSSPPPPPPANVSYIIVTPDPVALFVGQSQQFIATAYDASGTSLGVLPNSNLSWSATSSIGTIDANGTFSASSAGSGAVTAVYSPPSPTIAISDNASVTVSQFLPGPIGGGSGGSGGSNSNGGGSFKTSTTVSFSCMGKPGDVKITVYDLAVKNATVEIIYAGGSKNEKVLVKEITGTTTLSFTPDKAGDYTLRVSVGTEQTNANFFVPYCGPQTVNVTQNITVRLEPVRELVFTKLVSYPGGFSKRFSVYKTTDGQAESFESDIVLYLNYTGNSTRYDFDILDSVPSSVLTRSSQITFADRPSILSNEPKFEWHVKSISKGGRLSYAYSFPRQLTEQMIALFDAPTIREAATGLPPAKPAQDAGLLSASIGPIFGLTLPLMGVLLAFLVLLVFLYFFLFGKRKDEE